MFVKTANNEVVTYPYSVDQFRADNSTVSFPAEISNDTLASYGVYPVGYQPAPSYDPKTQRIEVSNVPSLVSGSWVLTKTVVSMTEQQIESYTATQADKVRLTRDSLLAETDWCALSDVTMSSEMTTYRQALRDVPAQTDFPHTVVWPAKPTED